MGYAHLSRDSCHITTKTTPPCGETWVKSGTGVSLGGRKSQQGLLRKGALSQAWIQSRPGPPLNAVHRQPNYMTSNTDKTHPTLIPAFLGIPDDVRCLFTCVHRHTHLKKIKIRNRHVTWKRMWRNGKAPLWCQRKVRSAVVYFYACWGVKDGLQVISGGKCTTSWGAIQPHGPQAPSGSRFPFNE